MKSKFVWTMPVVAQFLIGSWSIALADTSDVKGSCHDRGKVRKALQR